MTVDSVRTVGHDMTGARRSCRQAGGTSLVLSGDLSLMAQNCSTGPGRRRSPIPPFLITYVHEQVVVVAEKPCWAVTHGHGVYPETETQ